MKKNEIVIFVFSILTGLYPPPPHLDKFKLKKHCEIVMRSLIENLKINIVKNRTLWLVVFVTSI